MGYRLTGSVCSTSINRRTQGGAGDALSIHFAPLRHLRHPLIGEREVAQWRTTASRAYSRTLRRHHDRLAPFGLADMALACTTGGLTNERTEQAGKLGEVCGIHLIIGSCVLRLKIRELSIPRQIPSPSAGRRVQCQLPRLFVARDCRQRHTPASAHQRASGGLCARSPFPCASRPPIGRVCVPYKPLQDSEMQRHRHLSDDQRERVFARNLAATFTIYLLEDARGPGDRRNVSFGDICRVAGHLTGGRVPVGGANPARRIIDLSSHFRGPVSQNLVGPGSENLGWPVKPAALTQPRLSIALCVLSAAVGPPGVQTHQRPSGGAP
jgi:hypothetical protein